MFKVFVLGVIEDNGRYLLMKRVNPPRVWSGPSGWVSRGESPEESLVREIKEECNLEVKIISPLLIWNKNKGKALGLVYLCQYVAGQVTLNHEHSDYTWKTLKEIKQDNLNCSPAIIELENAEKIIALRSELTI